MSVGAEAEDTYLVDQSDEFRSMIVELDRSTLTARLSGRR